MDIYRTLDTIPLLPESVLTIGTFDGCHRGHQEIIKKVYSLAQFNNTTSVLITFDPHPRHVLESGDKLPLLMHINKKLEILKSLHLDVVLVIPFDEEFSHIKAGDFLQDIVVRHFKPTCIIVGYDHHFGFKREGSPEFLNNFGKKNNISVDIVSPIADENVNISSSHIRELIKQGFVRRASFELGWVFGFEANVIRGAGRGKSLGFPTANFIPEDLSRNVEMFELVVSLTG
jgi:riboflavin kinase/FMN adenylyltransferase